MDSKKVILVLTLRPTLDKGPGSHFLGTNLDWFVANWILELDCTLVPSLILGSLKSGALHLGLFFGWNQLIFHPKQVPCRCSLNLPLFGFGSLFKGLGTNLKLLTNKIVWIHRVLDPRVKSPLNLIEDQSRSGSSLVLLPILSQVRNWDLYVIGNTFLVLSRPSDVPFVS
jgi:hypothetical protein